MSAVIFFYTFFLFCRKKTHENNNNKKSLRSFLRQEAGGGGTKNEEKRFTRTRTYIHRQNAKWSSSSSSSSLLQSRGVVRPCARIYRIRRNDLWRSNEKWLTKLFSYTRECACSADRLCKHNMPYYILLLVVQLFTVTRRVHAVSTTARVGCRQRPIEFPVYPTKAATGKVDYFLISITNVR